MLYVFFGCVGVFGVVDRREKKNLVRRKISRNFCVFVSNLCIFCGLLGFKKKVPGF